MPQWVMAATLQMDVGLCADCQHSRIMRSDRGGTFYQCRLSATNPAFAKYPRLPVRECTGYDAAPVAPDLNA